VTVSELLPVVSALESITPCGPRSAWSRRTARPVHVREEIVRNHHVVGTVRESGAVFADELGEAVLAARRLLRSRRLVGDARRYRARGLRTIDATGPVATEDHREALDIAAGGCARVVRRHMRFILPRPIRQAPAAQAE
jgi:4-hydroxy-3-methylbut-2-enyl diphosphate reductase IspH